ncbi:HAD family phosphatase [Flavobacteriaceae bacterium S356]|uniref:HAD family phosphatase n=1 Tax=Asprobacillus argus TaxID=3076534 RepID=A0ABU3LH89_9FLAO|nr:HAD family phosphatase [Flavobacteriaceae bacterium S356]
MIKNIVFDYGDVFINLDKKATAEELAKLGVTEFTDEMRDLCFEYEMGMISTDAFVQTVTKMYPQISREEFIDAWNAILKDFPLHRLEFLKELAASKKYRLFLLSNTNDLHISWIKKDWGEGLYTEFMSYFEKFYLSHEINLRKPDKDIYEFVLRENNLVASETIFIDDTKENTDAAKELGKNVWHIDPETEDIVNLLKRIEF